ncbi:Sodium-dependent dopamine transporter [Papilio machaon]|uniref:Sodium-dependent dopamine transporter n=1 Tax=Papilio machaon TaxID=76193 RepID=A0A194R996_PAPMA|nr:Sodium-dependent dopamine transporter [Papilio machaon]
MEAVDMDAGRYELRESLPGSSVDSDASSSLLGSNDVSEHSDKTSDDEEDLREDLQKTIPECYKSDSNFALHSTKNITNDEEFQATALCQFMDILNDLDEVLDKSLLACLDDTQNFDSDEEDIICKLKDCIADHEQQLDDSPSESSMDNTQVVIRQSTQSLEPASEDIELVQNLFEQPQCTSLRRSKSYSELPQNHRDTQQLERANTMNDNLRNSMRRLDPIVLPALNTESVCEPLTLPVILFLEHHVNMRPTSAPLQLQVTAANLSTSSGSSGPIIVGRRALLMNRALSLPSPGDSDITSAGWNGPNGRSIARSTSSTSSSSGESLAGIAAMNQNGAGTSDERNEETDEPPFGVWPHRMSSMLACLSCTIGIFNISRFSVFSVHYGACFILQFFILSLFTGIPLFTLHLCLGHVLQSGPIDMWRISPIFKGVGVSLLLTQAVIGMYSIISLSWIFVYFRDSFITSDDKYKWALPLGFSFDDVNLKNSTFKIQETIPQYFHGEVLQRGTGSNNHFGTIKYQVALYLAVVWMIVFVALSKGLRSYGKSWAAAAQETFLTWGLLGACVMQLTSHRSRGRGHSTALRQSGCVIACTFSVLLLAACLANTCVRILKNNGYVFLPSSFETVKSSEFLWATSEPLPGSVSTPVRYMGQYGSLVGVSVWRSGNTAKLYSGWQPLQLATQIVPATLAVVPASVLSPAWAVIFFFILLMFGVAQQLAIWHCVITGVMAINKDALRVWETTITFFSCVFGFAMGLLLSTDAGIRVVHLMDYVWVGSWWQCAVQVALSAGVFAVRGRPYSADAVAAALYRPATPLAAPLAALLAFTWSVLLPVLLCAICIMDFRIGQQRQLYSWRKPIGYFPIWARQVAVMMQQGALLTVPIVAFIQTWRYMNKGPPDILERIQNLYRPRMGGASESPPPSAAAPPPRAPPDPPPKYTPPPSYSTATGARLINTLRRSFRTLRRITSGRTDAPTDDAAQIPITVSESVDRRPPTPKLHTHPHPFHHSDR